MSINTRYVSPDEIIESPYPYRRVWFSIILEIVILFVLCVIIYVTWTILSFEPPQRLINIANLTLLALPVCLWGIFSVWRERSAAQPRQRLFAVFVLTFLAANAVSLFIVETIFQPSRWLPHETAVSRIIGYTLTVGVVQVLTQYLVVYYTVYPRNIRVRSDAIAYFTASAIGYATALNMRAILDTNTSPAVYAIIVFNNVAVSLAMGFIVGYGLAETRFSERISPFLLTVTIILSALVYGLSTALRAGLVNASFSLRGGLANPFLGIGLSLGILIATGAIVAFLNRVAEQREAQVALERT